MASEQTTVEVRDEERQDDEAARRWVDIAGAGGVSSTLETIGWVLVAVFAVSFVGVAAAGLWEFGSADTSAERQDEFALLIAATTVTVIGMAQSLLLIGFARIITYTRASADFAARQFLDVE